MLRSSRRHPSDLAPAGVERTGNIAVVDPAEGGAELIDGALDGRDIRASGLEHGRNRVILVRPRMIRPLVVVGVGGEGQVMAPATIDERT
jgi:hypothetical protein